MGLLTSVSLSLLILKKTQNSLPPDRVMIRTESYNPCKLLSIERGSYKMPDKCRVSVEVRVTVMSSVGMQG